ncbi:uncharacterized protein LOC117228587 isoform X1 [Megalopta genalis]|uniref:uncharacterized protein LOC117228587 isoform X1 n=1 Tax=Megalopta genalis TaxID=115081 RepID=UPI003FD10C6E
MSARSQRGIHDSSTAKKLATPRFAVKTDERRMPAITYDYDAAVSQPDVPNFLNARKNGRCPMVSGASLGKRAVKVRNVRGRFTSGKNFQKRYQAPGATRRARNNAAKPAANKTVDSVKESTASGTSDEEKDEKGNDVGNGVVDVEDLTNFLKQTTETQNLSYKITTIEVIGKGNADHAAENVEDDEKAKENEEPLECKNTTTSPVPPVKSSRIPRAKIVALPMQTVQEFRSGKRTTTNRKLKDCTNSKCPPGCDLKNNVELAEKGAAEKSDQAQGEIQLEEVRLERTVKETKIVWDDEKTSGTEASGFRAQSSTDDSAALADGVNDPRVLSILQTLKLNCPCKTCTNQDLASSSRPEDDSDLKSSSPEECKKKKWPLRHREYVDTSSEATSSDRNNDREKRKKWSKNKAKNPPIVREKATSLVNASLKSSSGRQRSNFSFFNTLFDIVFWPYVFLKSNR